MAIVKLEMTEYKAMQDEINRLESQVKQIVTLNENLAEEKEKNNNLEKDYAKKLLKIEQEKVRELESSKNQYITKTVNVSQKILHSVRPTEEIVERMKYMLKEIHLNSAGQRRYETTPLHTRNNSNHLDTHTHYNSYEREMLRPYNSSGDYLRMTEARFERIVEEFMEWAIVSSPPMNTSETIVNVVGFEEIKEKVSAQFHDELDAKLKSELEGALVTSKLNDKLNEKIGKLVTEVKDSRNVSDMNVSIANRYAEDLKTIKIRNGNLSNYELAISNILYILEKATFGKKTLAISKVKGIIHDIRDNTKKS